LLGLCTVKTGYGEIKDTVARHGHNPKQEVITILLSKRRCHTARTLGRASPRRLHDTSRCPRPRTEVPLIRRRYGPLRFQRAKSTANKRPDWSSLGPSRDTPSAFRLESLTDGRVFTINVRKPVLRNNDGPEMEFSLGTSDRRPRQKPSTVPSNRGLDLTPISFLSQGRGSRTIQRRRGDVGTRSTTKLARNLV